MDCNCSRGCASVRLGASTGWASVRPGGCTESLRNYIDKGVAMTDYLAFRELDYDSGPTESLCGTLTDRLKGSGMRWNSDNAESMMALGGLFRSNLWKTYWQVQSAAIAARILPHTPRHGPQHYAFFTSVAGRYFRRMSSQPDIGGAAQPHSHWRFSRSLSSHSAVLLLSQ